MSRLDPHKPIMIAEWATGEFPHSAEGGGVSKAEWIREGLEAVSLALSAHQGCRILARAVAERRWILQQSSRELFRGSSQSVPRRRRES